MGESNSLAALLAIASSKCSALTIILRLLNVRFEMFVASAQKVMSDDLKSETFCRFDRVQRSWRSGRGGDPCLRELCVYSTVLLAGRRSATLRWPADHPAVCNFVDGFVVADLVCGARFCTGR